MRSRLILSLALMFAIAVVIWASPAHANAPPSDVTIEMLSETADDNQREIGLKNHFGVDQYINFTRAPDSNALIDEIALPGPSEFSAIINEKMGSSYLNGNLIITTDGDDFSGYSSTMLEVIDGRSTHLHQMLGQMNDQLLAGPWTARKLAWCE